MGPHPASGGSALLASPGPPSRTRRARAVRAPEPPSSTGGFLITAGRSRSVVLPALLLVLLLAAADLWAAHHFGVGIRDPGQLAVLLSAAGAAYGVVGWFLTKEEREGASTRLRDRLRPIALSPWLIAVLWAAFLVATLLFSSLTIVGEPGGRLAAVTVVPQDTDAPEPTARTAGPGDRQLRIPLLTSPLAGPYVVRADGYLPTSVDVLPLVGARLRLGRDVARVPSLLIRPAGDLLDALRLAGQLQVLRRTDELREIARSQPGDYGSFLIGPAQPTLRDYLSNWERELVVQGVSGAVGVNRHLLDWQRVHSLPTREALGPGDTVVVRVLSRAGRTMAEKEIVLRTVDLEDVFLGPGR